MLDYIQYEFWFLFTTQADQKPGAGAETSTFRLWLQPKVPALAAPAPQHCIFEQNIQSPNTKALAIDDHLLRTTFIFSREYPPLTLQNLFLFYSTSPFFA